MCAWGLGSFQVAPGQAHQDRQPRQPTGAPSQPPHSPWGVAWDTAVEMAGLQAPAPRGSGCQAAWLPAPLTHPGPGSLGKPLASLSPSECPPEGPMQCSCSPQASVVPSATRMLTPQEGEPCARSPHSWARHRLSRLDLCGALPLLSAAHVLGWATRAVRPGLLWNIQQRWSLRIPDL